LHCLGWDSGSGVAPNSARSGAASLGTCCCGRRLLWCWERFCFHRKLLLSSRTGFPKDEKERGHRRRGGGSSCTAGGCVPVGSRLSATWPRAGSHPFPNKFRGIREGVRCRDRRSPHGPVAVTDLTNLSAGGFRSAATVGAADRPKGAIACRMGADPRNGLAATEWQHARKNCRRPRTPVLGPQAPRVRGTKESRNPNSPSAEAGLLRSKRVLLGRSDSVSSRRTLERCSGFLLLERSGSSHRSES
jgi:hypothetical protein